MTTRAARVAGPEAFSWNPPMTARRPLRLLGISSRRRVNNFGDLIGPIVVGRMLARRTGSSISPEVIPGPRLLSVGSVLHLAEDGDTVWGSGVNGKMPTTSLEGLSIDVRAVRGPLTAGVLREHGMQVPDVSGDPAMLLPHLFPEMLEWATTKKRRVTVVPNRRDAPALAGDDRVVSPVAPVWECLRAIAESELVVGSSLHGVIVAESLGIPAVFVESEAEDPFKYRDYLTSTGRDDVAIPRTVDEAVAHGGYAAAQWDPAPLLAAFPFELWGL